MNKIILLLSISTICIFTGCVLKMQARFEIKNNTRMEIDSLQIVPSSYQSSHYISLMPHEVKKYVTDMSSISKTDGDYTLQYKINQDSIVTMVFGYYTNGIPLEKITKIQILPDTVIFSFKL